MSRTRTKILLRQREGNILESEQCFGETHLVHVHSVSSKCSLEIHDCTSGVPPTPVHLWWTVRERVRGQEKLQLLFQLFFPLFFGREQEEKRRKNSRGFIYRQNGEENYATFPAFLFLYVPGALTRFYCNQWYPKLHRKAFHSLLPSLRGFLFPVKWVNSCATGHTASSRTRNFLLFRCTPLHPKRRSE